LSRSVYVRQTPARLREPSPLQPPVRLMQNPLRTEEGAFRLLLWVLAVVVVAIAAILIVRAVG
jgi:hypothetical protein